MKKIKLYENMWKKMINFINIINTCSKLDRYYLTLIETLRNYIPYDSAHLISYDEQQDISNIIAVDIQEKTIENYRENFQKLDPIKINYFNQPQAIKSTLLFDYNKWTTTNYFENFLNINDFYYLCGIDIHSHRKILITISLIRSKNNTDFTTPEMLFLNRISPSISSHINLLKKLSPARQNQKSFAAKTDDLNFTAREKEIALLVKSGLSNREISIELLISVNTVKKHLQNIYNKSEVRNKRALVAKLYEI